MIKLTAPSGDVVYISSTQVCTVNSAFEKAGAPKGANALIFTQAGPQFVREHQDDVIRLLSANDRR